MPAEIEVICLYCESGIDEERGEAIERVTVSNVRALDEGSRTQLANWGFFRGVSGAEADVGAFANYCVHCGWDGADERGLWVWSVRAYRNEP